MQSKNVSAMELALMGGWPTKDGQAGSGAFEFIRKGSGRKPGAAEAIFFAQNSRTRNAALQGQSQVCVKFRFLANSLPR